MFFFGSDVLHQAWGFMGGRGRLLGINDDDDDDNKERGFDKRIRHVGAKERVSKWLCRDWRGGWRAHYEMMMEDKRVSAVVSFIPFRKAFISALFPQPETTGEKKLDQVNSEDEEDFNPGISSNPPTSFQNSSKSTPSPANISRPFLLSRSSIPPLAAVSLFVSVSN